MIKDIIKDTTALLTGTPTFVFANLFEANAIFKNFETVAFPVVIYIAPTEMSDAWGDGAGLYATQPIEIAFMDRFAEENDPTTEQVTDTIIEPMTNLAREFYKKISQDSRVKVNPSSVGDIGYQVIYSEFDARLFGVIATADVPYQITQPKCTPSSEQFPYVLPFDVP